MPIFYAFLGSTLDFQQASIPVELQTSLFLLSAFAIFLLVGYIVWVKFPAVAERITQVLHNLVSALGGQKREARLNKVVCYHCHKGMGIYNPVYFMVEGEPYIKGTCSLCGEFVSVRLN